MTGYFGIQNAFPRGEKCPESSNQRVPKYYTMQFSDEMKVEKKRRRK